MAGVDAAAARTRLAAARVARLATASADGVPHLVPIVFAIHGERLYFAVDHKPKRGTDLRRLRNIAANPAVSVLADEYSDDWRRLWWVRADGSAEILVDHVQRTEALNLLAAKYEQYRAQLPQGPVVAVTIHRITGWSFT